MREFRKTNTHDGRRQTSDCLRGRERTREGKQNLFEVAQKGLRSPARNRDSISVRLDSAQAAAESYKAKGAQASELATSLRGAGGN